MAFHPYLFFGGNCRDAFTRYEQIFGGELTLMRMGDAPSDDPVPPEQAEMIIHASLTIGDALLMGSDDPTTDNFGPVQGMMVSYDAGNLDEAKRVFEALSKDGEVTQPLIETFFSPGFGMCNDAFGTPWMITAGAPEEG
jgi:PhnB protein